MKESHSGAEFKFDKDTVFTLMWKSKIAAYIDQKKASVFFFLLSIWLFKHAA